MILKPTTYRDKIKKEINFYKENKNKFEQFMTEDNESAIIMYFHGWINIIKKIYTSLLSSSSEEIKDELNTYKDDIDSITYIEIDDIETIYQTLEKLEDNLRSLAKELRYTNI